MLKSPRHRLDIGRSRFGMGQTPAKIVLLGGDGIGPEVVGEARRVLEALTQARGIAIEIAEEPYGLDCFKRHGMLLREETLSAMRAADAVLFGATGGLAYAELPEKIRKAGNLLAIRKALGLYANLRPVFSIPALAEASSLKARTLEGVDLVIVRELAGGMYFGEPRGIETLPDGRRRGVNTHVYTSDEIERIARVAFELARTRSRRVTSVDKANVMEAGRLWREVVTAAHAADYRDVELSHMLADNCALQLGRNPRQFDVLVTDNLFGDVLSDGAANVMGSLGMLPSASLGPLRPDGTRAAFYEPVHGSAPDIAGKGVANPLGAILSVALLLRWSLRREEDARLLERAVTAALDGGARTADIHTPGMRLVSTAAMGDAVLDALAALTR
jgi:3-isopropylmalate dehydrogenase